MMTKNISAKYNKTAISIIVSFFLLLQIFPPLWVQDVTSLRHFLLALFDVSALGLIAVNVFNGNSKIHNPLKFKPIIVFCALIVFMAISIIWAINKIESLAVLNRWIIVLGAAILLGIILNNSNKAFDVLVYCTVIVAFVNVLTCIIGYYYLDVYISQRRNLMLNGGYGNKNIFAVCLLFKLPLLYYAVFRYKRAWKIISACLIFAICFCLVILSTRSTFIGLFLQLIVLFAYAIREKFRLKAKIKYLIPALVIILCALSGFFSGNKFIEYNYNKYASKNTANFYTVGARVKTIKEGNSKGRLLIWKNTSEIIKKNPLKGYGVGNHKLAIMQIEAKKKTNYVVSDHAHNDFLEMQSELGIIGELLYLLLYLSMFIIAFKLIWNKKTKEIYRLIALSSVLILLTYMNDALFNFPLERAACQIYLALSIALLMFAYYKTKRENTETTLKKTVLIPVSIFMLLVLYTETTHFYSSILQKSRIICHNKSNPSHIPPSYWLYHTPWLPNIDESTKPIAINNAMMFAVEGDYRRAVDIILQDNANPYYGLKEYRLASYYAHLKMVDSAIYWADKCIEMKPLCYDPVMVKQSCLAKKGDIAGQINLLTQYLDKVKNEPRAWLSLIDIYWNNGDSTNARQIYLQAEKNNPSNPKISAKKDMLFSLEN